MSRNQSVKEIINIRRQMWNWGFRARDMSGIAPYDYELIAEKDDEFDGLSKWRIKIVDRGDIISDIVRGAYREGEQLYDIVAIRISKKTGMVKGYIPLKILETFEDGSKKIGDLANSPTPPKALVKTFCWAEKPLN
jgi:hypothetical protein